MRDNILIDPASDSRWDEFVAAHPYGWICHLAGWKKVLEDTLILFINNAVSVEISFELSQSQTRRIVSSQLKIENDILHSFDIG